MQAVQDFNVSNPEGQQSNITDDQALAIFCEPDDGLFQMIAANSGKDGDTALVSAAVIELENRANLRSMLAELAQAIERGEAI